MRETVLSQSEPASQVREIIMLLLLLAWTVVAADGGGHDHGHGRSCPHGDQDVKVAIDKLDKQFLYLLSTIAGTVFRQWSHLLIGGRL